MGVSRYMSSNMNTYVDPRIFAESVINTMEETEIKEVKAMATTATEGEESEESVVTVQLVQDEIGTILGKSIAGYSS